MVVKLSINILNIDRIDTVHMMFALTMEYSLEWRDHRLRYKNLKEGLVQNRLNKNVSSILHLKNRENTDIMFYFAGV